MASSAEISDPTNSNAVCINDVLRDDELRAILTKLDTDKDKELFSLVCNRWLRVQSSERRRICARAGPHMLRRIAVRFTRLHELDLSQSVSRSFYPGVTDSDLAVIASAFTSLRVLLLQNCKGITDSGIVAVGSGLSSLQTLDVSYCRKLTDIGLLNVAQSCHDMRNLNLAGCRHITNALLENLAKNCPNLEELCLEGCTRITDLGLTLLVGGCQKINYLSINKCSSITDAGISSISKSCPFSLRTLKMLDCFRIGDESILSLAKYCRNLETLVIGGCREISDESMKSLAAGCGQSLKNLRMDWCSNISDVSLNSILAQCINLEILDIGCCEEVTDSAFQGLRSNERQLSLKLLKANNCLKITMAGISLLLELCSCLKYLDVRSCPYVTKAGCEEAGLQFPEHCKVVFDCSSYLDPGLSLDTI
ncbi:F-box/LRR-repeat protein 2 [Impatiens glandulifera]|uniref:F-box/LRR-repeat protein 2 n=1 Tax=Impatiens glandulifera TaxID=253017 RepID=UPI001FB08631|nr:F-box/LRR-repeat protein 2 [Impatiens glandulifera]